MTQKKRNETKAHATSVSTNANTSGKITYPQGVVMLTSVAGNSASASSASSLMDRFEYFTKSSEEVEAFLIFVKRSLCAFLEEEITRFG